MLRADDLLELWAGGRAGTPTDGALGLLSRVQGDIGSLTPGTRDRELLLLHASDFGPRLDAVVPCPACAEVLELSVSIDELLASVESLESVGSAGDGRMLRRDDVEIAFRLPTVGDLCEGLVDGAALLDRCITSATVDGSPVVARDLPAAVRDAVEEAMRQADPCAEITVAIVCPSCGYAWDDLLDPTPFVWQEVGRSATRLVEDIVDLASAFGWSERKILALSPSRRRLYLDRVRSW
jgi:hypothetical protein